MKTRLRNRNIREEIMMKSVVIVALGLCLGASVTGCHSISEEACLSGSWEDIGFKDGEAGRSRSRLADISERCAKFNVTPDRTAYIRGLEMGLIRFVNPIRGLMMAVTENPRTLNVKRAASRAIWTALPMAMKSIN